MKVCSYCGLENPDENEYCARCGSAEWKREKLIVPVEEKLPPSPVPFPAIITTKVKQEGSQTVISCRTMREAILVADLFKKADILAIIPDDEPDKEVASNGSGFQVKVSTSAYLAASELQEATNPDLRQIFPQVRLRPEMKFLALLLPLLPPIGVIVLASNANRLRNRGYISRAREWKIWCLYGWLLWGSILIIIISTWKYS